MRTRSHGMCILQRLTLRTAYMEIMCSTRCNSSTTLIVTCMLCLPDGAVLVKVEWINALPSPNLKMPEKNSTRSLNKRLEATTLKSLTDSLVWRRSITWPESIILPSIWRTICNPSTLKRVPRADFLSHSMIYSKRFLMWLCIRELSHSMVLTLTYCLSQVSINNLWLKLGKFFSISRSASKRILKSQRRASRLTLTNWLLSRRRSQNSPLATMSLSLLRDTRTRLRHLWTISTRSRTNMICWKPLPTSSMPLRSYWVLS